MIKKQDEEKALQQRLPAAQAFGSNLHSPMPARVTDHFSDAKQS